MSGASVRVEGFLECLGLKSQDDLNRFFLERDAFLTPWAEYRDECLLTLQCMEDSGNPHLTPWVAFRTMMCLRKGSADKIKDDADERVKCRLYTVRFLFDLIQNLTKPGEYFYGKRGEDLVEKLFKMTKLLCTHYRAKVFPVIHVIERNRPSTVEDYEYYLLERDNRVRMRGHTPSRFDEVVGSGNVKAAVKARQPSQSAAPIRNVEQEDTPATPKTRPAPKPQPPASVAAPVYGFRRASNSLQRAAENRTAISFSIDGEEFDSPKAHEAKEQELVYPKFSEEGAAVKRVDEEAKKPSDEESDEESLFVRDRTTRESSDEEEAYETADEFGL
ncbi:uncharacterized protein BDZ99DRAFT_496949 [Mytilinidion resinicola]|uniref:Uncharacterized protein n=1 Tax=Mytilinidion resinicola TaxID=574789 RepID=A0A6A6YUB7_9PEZI|nr:uncharacterized protein BDZ99DRAFT_496949 [Mytilinidion resinicola]KAF2812556.1 hypothetical protein BDZ99DRAFT_496949 [Mytilinidion resinicola]